MMVVTDAAQDCIPGMLRTELRAKCAAVRREVPAARLVAVWDFDGTLLNGDCSEGLDVNGRVVYPGLVQIAIERGYAADYSAADGFAACWRDYRWMESQIGAWLAYPFLAQLFAGASEVAMTRMATAYFSEVLEEHYFVAARELFDSLAQDGVEQHIISASPQIFVRGAAETLGVLPKQIHGIRVRTEDGLFTRELLPPVTYADGKKAMLMALVGAMPPGAPVFIIAAFGNSYAADGALLAHVAMQHIPGVQASAVMVNGGACPPAYHGLFQNVTMARTLRDTQPVGRSGQDTRYA